jgi:retinol dehydrogenase 12
MTLIAFLLLPLLINTAKTHNTSPRLVVVASEMHYMGSIGPDVRSTPAILEKVSSKEHCTKRFVSSTFPIIHPPIHLS